MEPILDNPSLSGLVSYFKRAGTGAVMPVHQRTVYVSDPVGTTKRLGGLDSDFTGAEVVHTAVSEIEASAPNTPLSVSLAQVLGSFVNETCGPGDNPRQCSMKLAVRGVDYAEAPIISALCKGEEFDSEPDEQLVEDRKDQCRQCQDTVLCRVVDWLVDLHVAVGEADEDVGEGEEQLGQAETRLKDAQTSLGHARSVRKDVLGASIAKALSEDTDAGAD